MEGPAWKDPIEGRHYGKRPFPKKGIDVDTSCTHNQSVTYEQDEQKRAENLRKHGFVFGAKGKEDLRCRARKSFGVRPRSRRKKGRGYQTRINALLRACMEAVKKAS